MSEDTETAERICAVCGRRLLLGERSSPYVSREGAEVAVCELCKARAESAGWLRPEEAAAAHRSGSSRGRRRGGLEIFGGIRARAEREREQRRGRRGERGAAESEPARRRTGERAATSAAGTPERASAEPPAGEAFEKSSAAEKRAKPAPVPQSSGEGRDRGARSTAGPDVSEALAAFNASENRRTIAGLTRSLGEPKATAIAVRTADGDTGARLTVAWELAWYQWEIGPGKRGPRIRQVAKGETVDQLRAADRNWNLQMAEDGTLSKRTGGGS